MRTIRTTIYVLLIVSILYIMLGVVTCFSNIRLLTGLETVDMPNYIEYIWPLPQSKTNSICYMMSCNKNPLDPLERGISVKVHTANIIDLEISQQYQNIKEPFIERVYLYVDDTLIPNASRVVVSDLVGIGIAEDNETYLVPDMSASYIFSWSPILLPGKHIAKIEIHTKSGTILEYRWSFLIW